MKIILPLVLYTESLGTVVKERCQALHSGLMFLLKQIAVGLIAAQSFLPNQPYLYFFA